MTFLGNIIWLVFGGFLAALGYLFGGIILCLTVVGIPWGLQCFKIAELELWPFGRQVISNTSRTGCLNLLYFLWDTIIYHYYRHSVRPPAFQTGRNFLDAFWKNYSMINSIK